jgi:16S rRNA (uracil1498-N3)-methyltransferase
MSRKCFYVGRLGDDLSTVLIQGDAAHHISRVLRLRVGENVELRDGLGRSWRAQILDISKSAVDLRILDELTIQTESAMRLTLGLALARADRMDWMVRQGTEAGVHRFAFFPASRSQYRLDGRESARRSDRWLKIAQEAMCQCQRTVLPQISVHESVDAFIKAVSLSAVPEKESLKVLAAEGRMEKSLMDVYREHPVCSEIVAVVGPEGGWSEGEVSRFEFEGFHRIHLGPRIMRFETAALAVMVSAQLLWGDLG